MTRTIQAEFWDRIARLDAKFHFCEDWAASSVVDRLQPVSRIGPLRDLCIGVKSNIQVEGQAWTAGIGRRRGEIAKSDADMIACLRSAGAILLSRLNMDEGALGAATNNPHFGRTENPLFPGCIVGGSSGGSTAAVACGAVDAALGTDTMGSVRIPAAYCGVFGLKLSSGPALLKGGFPLAPSLDSLGILAASLDPIRRMLEVISPRLSRKQACDGWVKPNEDMIAGCSDDIRAGLADVMGALERELGSPDTMPKIDLEASRMDAFLLTEIEAVQSFEGQSGLSPGLEKLIAYGRKIAPDRAGILSRLEELSDHLSNSLKPNKILVLPTVGAPPISHGERPPAGQADFTTLANITGWPALAIPLAGYETPVSVMLTGPEGSEHILIDLADKLLAARA